MARVIMRIEGNDGQLELLPDRVVIHRKGLWAAFKYGLNARREIPLAAIAEVGFRPAGFSPGEIEFVRSGHHAEKGKAKTGAVQFARKKNKDMEKFKERVFDMLNQFHNRNKSS